MDGYTLCYDRLWLEQYVDRLRYQQNQLRQVRYQLQRIQELCLPDEGLYLREILSDVDGLGDSMRITEETLCSFIESAQLASYHLESGLEEIRLPKFF